MLNDGVGMVPQMMAHHTYKVGKWIEHKEEEKVGRNTELTDLYVGR